MDLKDVDAWRKVHLAVAEWIDSWRLIPRGIIVSFCYGIYEVVKWYMQLKPYLLVGCIEAGGKVADCLVQAPTTQHTALLTALFALSAAVFGLYTSTSKKYDGFIKWNQPEDKKD